MILLQKLKKKNLQRITVFLYKSNIKKKKYIIKFVYYQ